MAQTNVMRADEISAAFNAVTDRKYWKASIAGTRTNPEINFNSRSSMVVVTYRLTKDDFVVTFAKSSVAFGDYVASAFRAFDQILASLKSAGFTFCAAARDDTVLRLEYDPRTKTTTGHIADHGEEWPDSEPLAFKVPERKNDEDVLSGIDL